MSKRKTIMERFTEKVDKTGDCWLWTGSISAKGYGFFADGKVQLAHRWVMENINMKKIPEGMCIDHLCRVRHCVNPEHLEIVTYKENTHRGKTMGKHPERAREFCKRGHKLEGDNVIFRGKGRNCAVCLKDYARERARIVKGYYSRYPERVGSCLYPHLLLKLNMSNNDRAIADMRTKEGKALFSRYTESPILSV